MSPDHLEVAGGIGPMGSEPITSACSAAAALESLQRVAQARGNVFGKLTETVRCNSLGQISHALHAVGGEYRRNM